MKIWKLLSIQFFFLFVLNAHAFSQIKFTESYKFSIPEKRGYNSPFSYVDLESGHYLRGARAGTGSYIDIYDLSTGSLKDSLRLSGISKLNNFVRTKDNKIWALDDRSRTLFLYDNQGNIEEKIDEAKGGDVQGPYTSYYSDMQFNPMLIEGDNIYWTTALLSITGKEADLTLLENQGMIRQYNTASKLFSWVGQIPENLLQYDYGYLNRFSATRNGNRMVVAPFYSNEILMYDLKNGRAKFPTVKKDDFYAITKPFAKLESNPRSLKKDGGGSVHYDESDYYLGILFDPFRNVYYRILQKRKKEDREKELVLVILDSSFNYVSHHTIPDKYNPNGMFITEGGLHILNDDKHDLDESHLYFDAFTFN